jgi:hypothetical protein
MRFNINALALNCAPEALWTSNMYVAIYANDMPNNWHCTTGSFHPVGLSDSIAKKTV